MLKRDEASNPSSCWNKARADERMFVLLARDEAAPAAIRAWVAERIRLNKNTADDPSIQDALQCATFMEDERLFSSRPPRAQRCPSCGHGHSERPYVLAPSLHAQADGVIGAIIVGASDIFEACTEAAEIATRSKRTVTFWFNGEFVFVNPDEDPDRVARYWLGTATRARR